jgi:hypothetical protein
MKKILIVSYHFPPSTASGGVRPSKFARYLPEFGWEPTVVTTESHKMSDGISRIHSVGEWPHPLKSYTRWKMRRAKRSGQEEKLLARFNVPYPVTMTPNRAGIRDQLFAFFWLPDDDLGWFIPAVRRAWTLIRKEQIPVMLTTGPPFTCHLIGLALKRLTGARWVADFRDPWALSYKSPLKRNRTTDAIEEHFIGKVMGRADRVVSVTTPMTELARKMHAQLDPDKFVTLTNGFDPLDFAGMSWRRSTARPVTFAYFGTFYHGRTPEPFLQALKGLIDEGMVKADDVRVRFVGNVAVAEGQPVSEMIRRFRMEEVVSVHPPVLREEALRQTVESDVVLVLDEQHPVQIPLKLYEGLAAGPVILNIGSRGAVSEVLAHTGKGFAVNHLNLQEIKEGILQSIRLSRSDVTNWEEAPWLDPKIQHFNFRNLTGQLACLLDGLNRDA